MNNEEDSFPRYICLVAVVCFLQKPLFATGIPSNVDRFVQTSCIGCHDESTETRLDFSSLRYDLKDEAVFRSWVHVYDRVRAGEMPPASETQPSASEKRKVLSLLKQELTRANLEAQASGGRVPSRRLTRSEYEHTLHDLLGIGGDLSKHLPPENASGDFDVVATKQGMSSVHVTSLLRAAELALDEAIERGPRPRRDAREIDYFHSRYIQMWVDRPVRRGGGTVFKTDRDVVTFRGENYVFRSDANGFVPPVAGRYQITIKAAAYQQRSSITVSLKRQNDNQGDSGLLAAWDLHGDDYREVSTNIYLRPDDYIYVSADELDPDPKGKVIYNAKDASQFGGEGVKIRRVTIEGPLESDWPPLRTRRLFPGIEWELRKRESRKGRQRDPVYFPLLTKSTREHLTEVIGAFARKALRREISDSEIDDLVSLAIPKHDDRLSSDIESSPDRFIETAKVPMRAILISPEFLFLNHPTRESSHGGSGDHYSAMALSDRALASRLSYLFWRSLPDDELDRLAETGDLSKSNVLAAQVDRMLESPKSERFVNEFLDQWLELDRIDDTTPDTSLYPEYDDILRRAMLAETRCFFRLLIDENLSVANLIDSNFTFLNRRLAQHYGIEGVVGEVMRKVILKPESVRGGLLTHASVAKITANGTVTTPVKRGNYVLSKLLGLPPNPPPLGIGAIKPDTRGATTIRETLQKHRALESCATCHRHIDPPGFAMECFDPVGTFRQAYRISKGVRREFNVGLRFLHKDYDLGPAVDASGTTADGQFFRDIRDFKAHLKNSTAQVARNVVSRLIVFATGGEIQFADREEIDRILRETQEDGYPMRSLIHQVVARRIFQNR